MNDFVHQTISSRQPFVRSIIKQYLPKDRSISILDLGCGYGAFLHELKSKGYTDIQGVEIDKVKIAAASSMGIDCIRDADIRVYLSTIPDSSIDVVLLIDILEHFPKSQVTGLVAEVYRTLKSGGKIIVHSPNAQGIFSMDVLYSDRAHEFAFTPSTAHEILEEAGFRNVEIREDKPLVHNIASLLRRCAWEILTFIPRLTFFAETGLTNAILSRSLLVAADKLPENSDRKAE